MNQKWSFKETELDGVLLIKPFIAEDIRGAFIKDYSMETFSSNGLRNELREIFYTVSHKNVVRAIHFQREFPQAKLVRCLSGKIWDVVVDLRRDSKSSGKWQAFDLSGDNGTQLYIPGCYGHGYIVLEPSIVSYKCDEMFYDEYDDGIIWNDSDLQIPWPIKEVENVILSDKDKALQTFQQFKERFGGL